MYLYSYNYVYICTRIDAAATDVRAASCIMCDVLYILYMYRNACSNIR